MQATTNKKINILEKNGIIPVGLNMPIDMKITDIRACKYDYYGNKYAASHESYENVLLSIKFESSKFNEIWITIFQGATYREEDTSCIIATIEPAINENSEISSYMSSDTISKYDCITEEDDRYEINPDEEPVIGLDSIKELLTAFDFRLYTEDESGLYDNGEGPTSHANCDFLTDIVCDILESMYVNIDERISKDEPDSKQLKRLNETLMEAASGKLYAVTVVHDSCIKAVSQFLTKDEAEKMFLSYCAEYYSEEGVEQYLSSLNYTSFEELSIEEWQTYYHSEAWYDINDLSNVEINLM